MRKSKHHRRGEDWRKKALRQIASEKRRRAEAKVQLRDFETRPWESTGGTVCTKRCHQSKGAAQGHADELERRGSGKLDTYFCKQCSAWHVGHKRKKKFLF